LWNFPGLHFLGCGVTKKEIMFNLCVDIDDAAADAAGWLFTHFLPWMLGGISGCGTR